MAGAARGPEMAQVSHHNLQLHNEAYRTPSETTTTTPLSPVGTITPFLHRAAPDPISPPTKAYFSPSRDSVVSKPSVSEPHSSPSRSSIASEKRRSSGPTVRSSQDHRHGAHRQSKQSSGPRSQRASRDVERYADSRHHNTASNAHSPISEHTTIAYVDDDDRRETSAALEDKAVSVLLYLCFPVALVSFLIAGWTVICLLLFLLAQPLRLLHARSPPSAELAYIISPSLRLQLRLIHSSPASEGYSTGMMVMIHLTSPFVSVGVAIAAWVAACFWFFSAILGDPAGKDGHNDGKESVLGVRAWWEGWLCRGLRS